MDKDFILGEIGRCAAENGGAPLGRERFYVATGIRETDWLGKYWIRWSDALKAAGFEANRFNQAHPEEHLLRQLALLVRDLGHFPIHAELRMQRRNDVGFPSANAFTRLGNKEAMIARVGAWCSAQPGFEDVAKICVVASDTAASTSQPEDLTEVKAGYVYLLRSKSRGYKIGMTSSVPRRWSEIENADPDEVELVHHFKTVDARGIEAYWLRRFDAQRKDRGEWFSLSRKHVAEFLRRSKSM